MLMQEDGKTNYAGRCAGCGAMRAATVADDARRGGLRLRDLADIIHEWIMDGLVIDRVDSDTVRAEFGDGCTCPKPPEQQTLFGNEAS